MTQAVHGRRNKVVVVLSSEDEEAAVPAVTPAKSKRKRVAPTRRSAQRDKHSHVSHDLQSGGSKATATPASIHEGSGGSGEDSLRGSVSSRKINRNTASTFAGFDAPASASHPFKASVETGAEVANKKPAASKAGNVPRKAVGNHDNATTRDTRKIFSFFNAATRKQQQDCGRTKSDSPEKSVVGKENELEDIIEDDSAGEHVGVVTFKENQTALPAVRKRSWHETAPSSQDVVSHSASQKYLKSTSGAKVAQLQVPLDPRPWSEKYGPTTLDEIVVHKKKVADVRQCIERIFKRQGRQKMLVLKGPAGSGKTTTVALLATALNAELIEWRNAGGGDFGAEEYVSMSDRFDDFLGRSRTFGGLELDSIKVDTTIESQGRQIVLVEEFPQITTSYMTALSSFRGSILQYLSAGASNPSGIPESALVMIISESVFAANSDADNFTAHRLLGLEILQHPSVTVLEFNPVAPTFISKALNQVLAKHSRMQGKMSTPTSEVIRQLTESGDVRNAISALEYLCLHSVPSITSSTVPSSKKKQAKSSKSKRAPDASAESTRDASSELVSSRESTLGLFHAVGKVVYNKRAGSASSPQSPLPPHLAHLERPLLPPIMDPMVLLSTSGTDASTFLSAVHENLPLSTPCLDTLLPCLIALSDSDAITPSRFASAGRFGTEIIRQEDVAFDAGIAGVLLHLPHPVVRSQGAHKLTYPAGLRTWRMKEEILQRLDLLVAQDAAGTLDRDVVDALGGALRSVQSNRGKQGGLLPPRRQEMLLERLPYMVHVLPAWLLQENPAAQAWLRDVQAVVSLTGAAAGLGVALDRGQDEAEEESINASPGTRGKLRGGRMGWQGVTSLGVRKADDAEMGFAKLVLSDDDIEDD